MRAAMLPDGSLRAWPGRAARRARCRSGPSWRRPATGAWCWPATVGTTAGNLISKRDVDKVFQCDEYSAMGIAGVLALAVEFAKLFQVETEHYEKVEGRALSLDGKAHRLASMIRANLGLAMQGLVFIPLFAGYDEPSGTGRIFSYDPAGGPSEEHRFIDRVGVDFRPGIAEEALHRGHARRRGRLCCLQARTTRPRTTRRRAGGHRTADPRGDHVTGGGSGGCRGRGGGDAAAGRGRHERPRRLVAAA